MQTLLTKKISFIITYYNLPAEMLHTCIKSILALTLRTGEREIIIVDDGSDECLINELAPYSDDIIYIRQRNIGLSAPETLVSAYPQANISNSLMLTTTLSKHPMNTVSTSYVITIRILYFSIQLIGCRQKYLTLSKDRWKVTPICAETILKQPLGATSFAEKR